VFGVGLEYFFTDESKRHVVAIVRRNERVRLPQSPEDGASSYLFESLDFPANERKLSGFFAEFQEVAPDALKPHTHAGVELLYLIEGKLAIAIGRQEYVLAEGDSIYFDATVPHTYQRIGRKRCTGIVVTT
jgi:mannose-6-phosphate isomerase-like protein (cupin superfamily)